MAVLYAFFSYSHLDQELDPELFAAFSSELEERITAQFVNDRLNIWRDTDGLLTGYKWNAAFKGDPQDVRDWPRLDPLAVHAASVAEAAFDVSVFEQTAGLYGALDVLFDAQGRYQPAEHVSRRALEFVEKNFGPDDPILAIRLNNLAELLRETNRLAEAEPHIHRAVKIHAASLDPDHLNTRKVANNYRTLLLQRGASEEEAEARVAAALSPERRHPSP